MACTLLALARRKTKFFFALLLSPISAVNVKPYQSLDGQHTHQFHSTAPPLSTFCPNVELIFPSAQAPKLMPYPPPPLLQWLNAFSSSSSYALFKSPLLRYV
jgi:hypothetical protein